MMDRKMLNYIPPDCFYDMPMLIETIKDKHKVSTFAISDYWADIGTMKDLFSVRNT